MILSDWYLAAKELFRARESGCRLLVDLTIDGLSPQPDLVMRAARLAGLDVVFGVGRYLAETLSDEDRGVSAEELSDRWLLRIAEGKDGWLPGIIGEIGTGEEIAPCEAVSLHAAARVQQLSGLPINVHVHPYARQALEALRILEEGGADLSKVAVSHCDGELDLEWLNRVLSTGCYVEMDMFGTGPTREVQGRGYPSDDDRVSAVTALVEQGWGERLLLSHDICHRNSLRTFGGWGYAHIADTIRPKLLGAIGDDETSQIMNANPLRFLDVPDGSGSVATS
jgi:phosphotriesterase-related protein